MKTNRTQATKQPLPLLIGLIQNGLDNIHSRRQNENWKTEYEVVLEYEIPLSAVPTLIFVLYDWSNLFFEGH